MSVFVLKIIGMVTMLVDHITIYLYVFTDVMQKTGYIWLRGVGRMAFPIFAFLIVNGYQKTHDVKRYLTRLVAFAAISQVPYVLATDLNYEASVGGLSISLGSRWFVCLIFILVASIAWLSTVRMDASVVWLLLSLTLAVLRVQYGNIRILSEELNVFYTLALGLALIALTDEVLKPDRDILKLVMQALGLFGAFFLIGDNMDYRTLGVALIYSIWLARESRFSQAGVMTLWCVVEYIVEPHPAPHFFLAMLAVLLLLTYNGKRGYALKSIFYAVYPVHLAVLGALTVIGRLN